ncbi:DUF721 domain-containing protein [Pararhodonellum marinum]|uniref:DUF721 domain-containing protein n=1 Tax=Pararhodonellum marinum TaxID=2755358 RepID=UPI00188EA150|nr:DUF721 domain-containing protein [Pararhodonellum marinum]
MTKHRDHTGRKKEMAPLKEAFDELLQAYQLKDKYNERMVVAQWKELMGNTVASRTTSLFIKDKVLFVKLASGPIKKELMMNKSKVMHLIDEKYGKGIILDLVFS